MPIDIKQGDIFWIDLGEPVGSAPGYRHPHVVVQNDILNASNLGTTVVCVLSSNVVRSKVPGNVLLPKGSGGLKRDSVAIVTQLVTLDKSEFIEKSGRVSARQLSEILHGIVEMLQPA